MNDPIAQTLAGIMMLCAFALLTMRQPPVLIALYRAQSLALTAAACWQGHTQHAAGLYVTAVIILTLNVALLPRLHPRLLQQAHANPAPHPLVLSALGIILLGLAITAIPASNATLAMPFAILLLGLPLIANRRDSFAQTIGLLTIANGLLLAAISLPSLPYIPEFAAALAAFAALPGLFSADLNLHETE